MLLQFFLIVAGFLILLKAADYLVQRIASLSGHMGLSEFAASFLLVGLFAIMPELSISLNSTIENDAPFGLGIILGSNVADLLLVIGIVAITGNGLKLPKDVARYMSWFLVPMSLPLILLLDGTLSFTDGALLVGAFIVYAWRVLTDAAADSKAVRLPVPKKNLAYEIMLIAVNLAVIFAAGNLIAENARELSLSLGLPLIFMGTLMAIGTCMPELSVALRANRKDHDGLGVGGIFGNVLADAMLVLGVLAMLRPIRLEVPEFALASTAMSIVALVLLGLFAGSKGIITRKQGGALVALYLLFVVFEIILERSLT